MEMSEKIIDSNIKTDAAAPEKDPAKVRELSLMLTPWHLDAAFHMLYICSYMQSEEGVSDLAVVAKEFNGDSEHPISVEKVAALVKVARTIVAEPMPAAMCRFAMYALSLERDMELLASGASVNLPGVKGSSMELLSGVGIQRQFARSALEKAEKALSEGWDEGNDFKK